MSDTVNIVIIGLGPRGVTILERLATILPNSNITKPIHIHIVDKGVLGEGVHSSKQPDYLLLNTVCSQITLFCDISVKNAGAASQGPSLYEWALQKGYRITANQELSLTEGREIEPNDYLPRALFGKYLQDITQHFIDQCQKFARVSIYQTTAEDIAAKGTDKYLIRLATNEVIKANYLYLSTGHSTNEPTAKDVELSTLVSQHLKVNEKLQYVANPYPIENVSSPIDCETTVAIEGLGLTAFDLLAALTIGKGGRFVSKDKTGALTYIKSGNEPQIVAYSLDNLPLQGRAINQKGVDKQYQAKFFTRDYIDWLRATRGQGESKQLDFVTDVLPILKKEIAYCYYTTLIKNEFGAAVAQEFAAKFSDNYDNQAKLSQLLDSYIANDKQIQWDKFFNPAVNLTFDSPADYKAWMIKYLKNDLVECYQGNVDGPYKAACDVLRDLRDTIRYAVDFGGLTSDSHKLFLQKYNSFMNRISVGPPKERIAQMLALIEAGVLDIFLGPQPEVSFDADLAQFVLRGNRIKHNPLRYADVIIKARIHPPLPGADQSLLMKNCLKKGLLVPYFNGGFHPGGVAIDKSFHPINSEGKSLRSIWAIGAITEGPKFYTYIVPRAGVNSTGLQDAGKAVLDMVRNMKTEKPEQSVSTALNHIIRFSTTSSLIKSPAN